MSASQNTNQKESIDTILSNISSKITSVLTKKNLLIPVFKYIDNNKGLYIIILFKHSTDLNFFKDDLYFSITLSETFPVKEPYVRCLSNFTIPTLFDNRNLLFSIINHNWSVKVVKNYFDPIEEIILQIPKFLKKLNEDLMNKTLVYYGDYIINDIYEMNDFLSNGEIKFFRIEPKLKKKIEQYVILTDIYFLLLEPAPDAKNLAKLIFYGDIRQLSKRQFSAGEDSIIVNYTGKESSISLEFSVIGVTLKEFIIEADRKIKRLNDRFNVFQEDEVKQGDSSSNLYAEKITKEKLNELKKLIEYKEKLLSENKTINLIRELTELYEKVIEYLSAEDNCEYERYLKRLKEFLMEKETLEHIDNETSSKEMFQLSKSYAEKEKDI